MTNTSDFLIENGFLHRYNGPGGDVVIPEGVIAIGNFAFSGCEGLTSVVIPDGVQEINSYAFSGCTSLTSVVIPEGVTKIDGWAFHGCKHLTIHAPAGSYAQQYAEATGHPFVAR